MRCSGVALAKVIGGGLVWGWIGIFLLVFSCRELLLYRAVARLHSASGVRGTRREGILSRHWHGGDGRWMVMARGPGLGMGKAINGICLHGYLLNLVWVELEGVLVTVGSTSGTPIFGICLEYAQDPKGPEIG
jgi:hypothetical protein